MHVHINAEGQCAVFSRHVMAHNLLCAHCLKGNVHIKCGTCRAVGYCSEACGNNAYKGIHAHVCDAMAHAKHLADQTASMRRPREFRERRRNAKTVPKASPPPAPPLDTPVDLFALSESLLPTKDQLNDVPPMPEELKKKLLSAAQTIGDGPVAVLYKVLQDHRVAQHNRVLVDRYWTTLLKQAGVSPQLVEGIQRQWQDAEQTFAKVLPTEKVDLKMLGKVSDHIRTATVAAASALGGDYRNMMGDLNAYKGDALSKLYALIITRMAARHMKDHPKASRKYFRNDAETRMFGDEPDPRWEGTDEEVGARIANGTLPKPSWWNARYDWIELAAQNGTFVPQQNDPPTTSNNTTTTIPIGARGPGNNKGKEEEDDDDFLSDDDESYEPDPDDEDADDLFDGDGDPEALAGITSQMPSGGNVFTRLFRWLWGRNTMAYVRPIPAGGGDGDGEETDGDVEDYVSSAGTALIDNGVNLDYRSRRNMDRVHLIELDHDMSRDLAGVPLVVRRGIITRIARWFSPVYVAEGTGIALSVAVAGLFVYGVYGVGLGFAELGPDAYRTLAGAVSAARQSITNQQEAAQFIMDELDDLQGQMAALGDLVSSEQRSELTTGFLQSVVASGGRPTLNMFRDWLRVSIPILRQAQGAPFGVGPLESEAAVQSMAFYEDTLGILEDPRSSMAVVGERLAALSGHLRAWAFGSHSGMTPEQQATAAEATLTLGRTLRAMVGQMQSRFAQLQGVTEDIVLSAEEVSRAMDDIAEVGQSEFFMGALHEYDPGTMIERLMRQRLGMDGAYNAQAILNTLMHPGILFLREMHRWIRTREARALQQDIGNEIGVMMLLDAPNLIVFTGTFLIFNHWKISWAFALLRWMVGRARGRMRGHMAIVYESLRQATTIIGPKSSDNVLEQIMRGRRGIEGDDEEAMDWVMDRTGQLIQSNIWYRMMGGVETSLSYLIHYAPFVGAATVSTGYIWEVGQFNAGLAMFARIPRTFLSISELTAYALPLITAVATGMYYWSTQRRAIPTHNVYAVTHYMSRPGWAGTIAQFTGRNAPAIYAAGRASYEYWTYILMVTGIIYTLVRSYTIGDSIDPTSISHLVPPGMDARHVSTVLGAMLVYSHRRCGKDQNCDDNK